MLNQSRVTWGGLKCHLVDALPAGQSPTRLVFLAHGFGAPGTDLVPLAEALFESEPALETAVRFVFPAAPLSLEAEGISGRAWWPLNLARLQSQLASGRFEDVRKEKPPGLPEARGMIHALIQDACTATGLTPSQCILGGFSQGAMVMMDAAVSLSEAVGGLVLLSGAVVNEGVWKAGVAKLSTIPVFQSHGRYDVVLPFLAGEWLRDLWSANTPPVEFVAFNDGHTIPWPVLTALGTFLKARLA
ncbi:MAG TPA: hypothetical protein VFG20_19015 [Planctomycetaceae bacterium]|nr:hypothetical protein [Planctomycetaceae bacterium]